MSGNGFPGRLSGRAATVGLVAFILVDVLLVAAAVNHVRGGASAGAATAGSSTISSSSSTSSGDPSTDGTPTTKAPEPAVALDQFVIAEDAKTGWRITVGSCADGGAAVAVTTNGGGSWTPRQSPFDTVTRLRVRADGTAFAVGGDKGQCGPELSNTSDQGRSWGAQSATGDAWFRDPRDVRSIGTTTGAVAKPCGSAKSDLVVDLAVGDSSTAALCGNGKVLRTTDGGSWKAAGTVDGARALSFGGDRLLVVGTADGCDGLAVGPVGGGQPACVPTGDVDPGQASLSWADGTWWLLAGDTTWQSTNATNWRKS